MSAQTTTDDDSTELQTEPDTQSVLHDEEYADDWDRLRELAVVSESFTAPDVSDEVVEAAEELGLLETETTIETLFNHGEVEITL